MGLWIGRRLSFGQSEKRTTTKSNPCMQSVTTVRRNATQRTPAPVPAARLLVRVQEVGLPIVGVLPRHRHVLFGMGGGECLG